MEDSPRSCHCAGHRAGHRGPHPSRIPNDPRADSMRAHTSRRRCRRCREPAAHRRCEPYPPVLENGLATTPPGWFRVGRSWPRS